MRRILFRWRGVTVWSYPAMLYVGLVAGVVAGNVAAHAVGIDAFRAYVATLVLIPLALVGARLLHVASYWRLYRRTPRRIWDRNDAGFAMYGGLPVVLRRNHLDQITRALRDVEELLMTRLALIVVTNEPTLAGFDPEKTPDRWAEERQFLRNDIGETLAAFRRRRGESLAFLRGLAPEQWDRSAIHRESP